MTDLSQILQVVPIPPLPIVIVAALAAIIFAYFRLMRWVRRLSMHFCIRGLSNNQRKILIEAGIPLAANAVSHDDDRITVRQLKLALKTLQAKVVSSRVLKVDRLEELILRFPAPKGSSLESFRVALVSGSTPMRAKRVEQVVRDVLMPTVRKDICIHSCWSRMDPVDDDAFHVFLDSSSHPDGGTPRSMASHPSTVWGLPVDSGTSYISSGKTPFIDEDSNFFVAELVDDNNLFVHFDVLDTANRGRRGLSHRLGQKLKIWGRDEHLGVLTYVLSQIEKDLVAQRYIDEVIAELRASGSLTALPAALNAPVGDAPALTVSVENIADKRRAEVLAAVVREVLLPVLQRDVELIDRQGATTSPRQRGKYRVLVNSSPHGNQWVPVPEVSFGFRLHGLGDKPSAFPPSQFGLPIADENGHTVAEFVGGRDLYLTSELIRFGTRAETKLFAQILLAVRRVIEQGLQPADAAAALFVSQLLAQKPAGKKGDLSPKLLRQSRIDLGVALSSAMAQQNELQRMEATPTEMLGREFDALLAIEKVLDVTIADNELVVHTDTLYCTDPRSRLVHEIGKFKIYVPVNGKGNVRWQNLTRRMGQHHAPHVGENGLGCLGNTTSIFPALIGKREFAGAIEVAIAFVESVNVDDTWGKQINKWPVATARGAAAGGVTPQAVPTDDDEDGDRYYGGDYD